MERRDISYAIAYFLTFVFAAIIGISFSVFVDKNQRVEVSAITIHNPDGLPISSGKKSGEEISLKVYSPKVGAKPVSGELDTQTDIPYTVSDQVGSEGAYAKFKIKTDKEYKVVLNSVSGIPQEDLDNVKISLRGSEKKAFAAKDIGQTVLVKKGDSKDQTLTVLVWLDQHVSKKIVGGKISLEFTVLENS